MTLFPTIGANFLDFLLLPERSILCLFSCSICMFYLQFCSPHQIYAYPECFTPILTGFFKMRDLSVGCVPCFSVVVAYLSWSGSVISRGFEWQWSLLISCFEAQVLLSLPFWNVEHDGWNWISTSDNCSKLCWACWTIKLWTSSFTSMNTFRNTSICSSVNVASSYTFDGISVKSLRLSSIPTFKRNECFIIRAGSFVLPIWLRHIF